MKLPFQAVAVRYVHDVLTGEFLNIGVVLLCPAAPYAGARFISRWSRVRAAFPNAELSHVRRLGGAIQKACDQLYPHRGDTLPLAREDDVLAFLSRVLPPDDAGIQFSSVIRGVTADPARTLVELTARYAERYLPEDAERAPRTDADVRDAFLRKLAARVDMQHELMPATLRWETYQYDFDTAWRNGKLNIAQPVSLDLLEPRAIKEKVMTWTGRVVTLHPSRQDAQITFLVGMPPPHIHGPVAQAAADAVQLLGSNLAGEADVVTEDRSEELIEKIARDVSH